MAPTLPTPPRSIVAEARFFDNVGQVGSKAKHIVISDWGILRVVLFDSGCPSGAVGVCSCGLLDAALVLINLIVNAKLTSSAFLALRVFVHIVMAAKIPMDRGLPLPFSKVECDTYYQPSL
jgi:hypothetical protein